MKNINFNCFIQLFLDEAHKTEHSQSTSEKKEGDFFHEHSHAPAKASWDDNVALSAHSSNQSLDKSIYLLYFTVHYFYSLLFLAEQQTEGPSVDPNALNNDGSTKSLDPKKSTIGQRRVPQAKKVDFNYLFSFK